MTRSPVGLRHAVVHAIATDTWYCAGRPADREMVGKTARRLSTSLRPGSLLDDPGLRDLRREVAGIMSQAPVPDLSFALGEIALDGIIDPHAYLFGDVVALTPAGVAAALEVRPMFASRNITTEWFDRFLTRDQYDRLVRHIAARVKHSRDDAEIRGFVHGYVLNQCTNDGLRDRIMAGNDPAMGHLRAWVWRHALSTFRNEGTDAQTRTVKGSRTEREVRGDTTVFTSPDVPSAVVYAVEGDDGAPSSQGNALVDVVDSSPTAEEILAHHDALKHGMARFKAAVRAAKPGAADRYARVLGHLARGLSPADVAREEGVSHARAATLIAEVRGAGRARATRDRVRVDIVRYLETEPMSTIADLTDDLGADDACITDAVSELVAEGVLAWRRGGSLHVARDMSDIIGA
jgi:hypothetical protein